MAGMKSVIPFADRNDAGRRLAERLGALDPSGTVILALPRGGVPVAAAIAAHSGAPLDLVLVRKIGAPGEPELAIGAVADGAAPQIVVNDAIAAAFGLSPEAVRARAGPHLAEIARRRALWLKGRPPLGLSGRTAVLVDDGIATGATMAVAIAAVRAAGAARVVLAVPVAASDALAALSARVDETVCLAMPEPFGSVGAHYRAFPQLADDEVTELLDLHAPKG